MWYEIGRSDLGSFFDMFLTGLQKRLGVSEEELAPLAQQKGIISMLLRQVIEAEGQNSDLETKYIDAVDSLAIFDPILAFRLSGKNALTRYREQSDTYLQKALLHFGQTDLASATTGVEMVRPFMLNEGLELARKTLRKDIIEVAAKLGRTPGKQVKRLLSDLQDRAGKDQQQEFEEYMDRATQMMQTLAAQLPLTHPSDGSNPLFD